MNDRLKPQILTPRVAELVSATESPSEYRNRCGKQVYAEVQRINITEARLTCCCEYKKYIICAGFSGELFFVDKSDFSVRYKEKVANSIIRCLKIIVSEMLLLISTDAGEVIAYDLQNKMKLYYEHSDSPIYNIVLKNNRVFITSEKNGDIFEWEYIPELGIFRNKKMFSAENTVFAMDIMDGKLIAVNSIGKKFEYNLLKSKNKKTNICESNVFCIKEGKDGSIYYGLSNGTILYEEQDSEICMLESHQDAVRDIAFSTEKEWMFSVSKDRTVRAWHKGSPKVLTRVLDYLYQIIFVAANSCLYYVDGHGDMGIIHFHSDIDSADNIDIIKNSK